MMGRTGILVVVFAMALAGCSRPADLGVAKDTCPCSDRAAVKDIRIDSPDRGGKNMRPLMAGATVGPYHCGGALTGIRIIAKSGASVFENYSIDRGSIICSHDGTAVNDAGKRSFDQVQGELEAAYRKNGRVTLGIWRERKSLAESLRSWSPFD